MTKDIEAPPPANYSFDTVAVFGALLTAAAATAFRQGAGLREGAEGLVSMNSVRKPSGNALSRIRR
ncbi:hypothetical protein HEK616_34630 [Streptomyces nigrescens]|uniref:Uncharacterized protein n=1 Tax=Streptomyces nigrescens TaxID=1920 RepID=A0ABN6QW88_STRNI|nr:hypothetical protein HEK616_34630 [Streptomyces nigrescens]